MHKITNKEASRLIQKGYFPKCLVARIMKPIRSLTELEQLQRLASVQPYELYGFSNAEISKFNTIPNEAISLTLDEAIEILYSGEEVFAKILGEKNIYNFVSPNLLLEFYKRNLSNGNSIIFYCNC